MFSGAEIPRPIITYPTEFTWISAKKLNQHVRKSLCPIEILSFDLVMLCQPKRNIKKSENRKGQ